LNLRKAFFEIGFLSNVVECREEIAKVSLTKRVLSNLHAFQLLNQSVYDPDVLLLVNARAF
jgi:hypothetical protein